MKALVAFMVTVLVMLLVSVLLAAPVMWLWDWLMPKKFGLPELTLLEAWGLTILCNLLFSSRVTIRRDD